MSHLTFELILWLLLAFFIGCILGCLFRKVFGGSKSTEAAPAPAAAVSAVVPESKTETKPKKKKKAKQNLAEATGVAKRPKGLAAARDGKADKLQRISGVGPKLDKTLNSLGYFHFDQIASWNPDEVQWVDEHLRFQGRINRDEWLAQAKLLADGNEKKFSKLYGADAKKNTKTGQT